jgi:polyisoprenoid-binding protein YceI
MKITAVIAPILHRQQLTGLTAILMACAVTGCSDPADKVAKAPASAPRETAQPGAAGKSYAIQPDSTIGFVGSKVTGSHDGGFKKFAGKLNVTDGAVTAAEVKIDMESTWTDNEKLTGHLKSPDFFDVAKYPTATFTTTDIKPSGAQKTVTGNLELHGVTKSVTFPADIQVADNTVTVKTEFAINRKDFNINYAGKADDLIRDNVILKLDIKATPGELQAGK